MLSVVATSMAYRSARSASCGPNLRLCSRSSVSSPTIAKVMQSALVVRTAESERSSFAAIDLGVSAFGALPSEGRGRVMPQCSYRLKAHVLKDTSRGGDRGERCLSPLLLSARTEQATHFFCESAARCWAWCIHIPKPASLGSLAAVQRTGGHRA